METWGHRSKFWCLGMCEFALNTMTKLQVKSWSHGSKEIKWHCYSGRQWSWLEPNINHRQKLKIQIYKQVQKNLEFKYIVIGEWINMTSTTIKNIKTINYEKRLLPFEHSQDEVACRLHTFHSVSTNIK